MSWAERPGGTWALFGLAFVESSVFIVPPDVLLLALCVGAPRRAFWFAAVCASGSVLGGMMGYVIGYGLWEGVKGLFIPYLFSQEAFDQVARLYEQNAFWAVLTAAFTPIPYKVFTIAAGVFKINFLALVAGSLVGRSARFFLVGGIIYLFGPAVKELVERYFDWFAWGFLVLLVGGFIAVRMIR